MFVLTSISIHLCESNAVVTIALNFDKGSNQTTYIRESFKDIISQFNTYKIPETDKN